MAIHIHCWCSVGPDQPSTCMLITQWQCRTSRGHSSRRHGRCSVFVITSRSNHITFGKLECVSIVDDRFYVLPPQQFVAECGMLIVMLTCADPIFQVAGDGAILGLRLGIGLGQFEVSIKFNA